MGANEFLHCADCGESDARVLELDQPIDEQSPCEVVCLYCAGHRIRRRWGALQALLLGSDS